MWPFCSHFATGLGSVVGCRRPSTLVGCAAVTYRPLPVRPRLCGLRSRVTGRRATTAGLLVAVTGVALLACVPAYADPRIDQKEAEARQVLGEIQTLDSQLEKAVEAYDAANVKLSGIRTELRLNRREMKVARANLGVAKDRLARRLRDLYVGGESASTLELFLGASSFEDLINRLETSIACRRGHPGARRGEEVPSRCVRGAALRQAQQAQVVAERAGAKSQIEADSPRSDSCRRSRARSRSSRRRRRPSRPAGARREHG